MTITEFITAATSFLTLVGDAIAIFLEPPLVWFVALGAAAAGLGMARRLIPKKKAG